MVLCVDKHGPVLAELEAISQRAQAGARLDDESEGYDTTVADPDFDPRQASLTDEA